MLRHVKRGGDYRSGCLRLESLGEMVACRYVDSVVDGRVWRARQDDVFLFDDSCERSEIEIVVCNGDVVWGLIDYELRC